MLGTKAKITYINQPRAISEYIFKTAKEFLKGKVFEKYFIGYIPICLINLSAFL